MEPQTKRDLLERIESIQAYVVGIRKDLDSLQWSVDKLAEANNQLVELSRQLFEGERLAYWEGQETSSFEEWSLAVDKVLSDRVGVVQGDLPDWRSRDAYDEGMPPQEAAEQCLEQAGYGEDWG